MEACRKKEAELLEFTQKLTETNVTLQSECAFIEGRASTLEAEHTRLTNKGLYFMFMSQNITENSGPVQLVKISRYFQDNFWMLP